MSLCISGTVESAGGGIVSIMVDRDTMNYPRLGDDAICTFIARPVPHTHNWSVFYAKSGAESLFLVCNVADCEQTRTVPNHALFPEIN